MKKFKVAKFYTPQDNKTTICLDFLEKNSLVFAGYTYFVLDDYKAYHDIISKIQQIKKQNKLTVNDICKVVQNYVLDYFGIGSVDPIAYIQKYKLEQDRGENVTLSSLKNTRISQCLERSTFAHNIFKLLNFDCALVASNINFDGIEELHSFNVLKINEDYYVFDLICSKIYDSDMPTPIMCKLPKNIGEQIFKQKLINNFKTKDIEFVTQSGYKHKICYEFVKINTLENSL